MQYQIIQQALKEIIESHVSGLTFVTGLESEIDTARVQYPIVYLQPPASTLALSSESLGADIWQIHLQSQELLSQESSTEDKQAALNRTRDNLKDIVHQFVYMYGREGREITVNNRTESLDFKTTTTGIMTPFIDKGANVTGHMIDFSIQEEGREDLCHLANTFGE